MKHDWYTGRYGDDDNNPDVWRLDEGFHNGPECRRCGGMWCEHCSPHIWDEECPSGQMDIFEALDD